MIVLANEVNEFGKNKGISCFVISSDSPGVHLGDESLTMGVRAIIQNSVHFKGAHVKKDDLLGRSGFGLDVIKHSLNMGRLVVSMASVSAIKRASQIMFRYAEHRKVSFGVLSDSTLFRESFYWNSQVSAALESSVKFICEQFDQGNSIHDDACTLLKIICPELAWQVVDNAMQTLGARGYIETNALPQLMRDVRLLRIFEGPTETLGDSLGRAYISHNSTVLKHLFTEKLNQPNLFAELESLKNRIILTVGDIDDSRIYVRYAILVGYAFIAAVNQDAHNIDVLDWSNRIYKKNYLELEQLLNDFSLPPNTSFLKVFADNLAIDIGNIYQQGTDEERFIDNYLIPDMYQNVQSQTSSDEAVPQHFSKQTLAEDELNVEAWLIEQLSAILKIDSSSLDAKSNIYDLNLDSISSVELAVLINSFYNVDLDEKFLFGNYSVADIAAEITSQIRQNS
jgi:acyl carrier protein